MSAPGNATPGRAWRAAAGLVLLALSLGACSSGGPGYFQRFGTAIKDTVAPAEPEPAPERTRAELDEIPYATIAVTFEERRAFLVPLADNEGYLDYRDSTSRGIRMLGGAVAGTEGLGEDLEAVRFASDDPVAHPAPLAEWPDELFRAYQFRKRERPQYSITLGCRYQRLARETVEIIELSYDLVRVSEICRNQRREVVNTYWVEEDTGFIWKSRQWLGPAIGEVRVEIIRPYSG